MSLVLSLPWTPLHSFDHPLKPARSSVERTYKAAFISLGSGWGEGDA